MGWREVWDGGVHRMAGFSRSLPMLFARGSLGQRYLASSRNAHGGLGPVLQLRGASSARPVRDPHPGALGHSAQATQSIRGNVAGPQPCGQELEPPADAAWGSQQMQGSSPRSSPEQLPALQCGAGVHGPHAPPPRSHSDPLRGTRASIRKRRSLKHRDVGKLLEATQ